MRTHSISFVTVLLLQFLFWAGACGVSFTITITEETRSPDGFARKQILANGQSPGPPLILNQGDNVEFLVINNLDRNTSIHFHGIEQLNTPWSDGVPGLSQYPIPAGGQFLYNWTATDYGTYFYHGHDRSQISDGLYGPIHIKPAPGTKQPFPGMSTFEDADLEAVEAAVASPNFVVISDWSHLTAGEYLAAEKASNYDMYCSNSILINGKANITCLSQAELEDNLSAGVKALLNGTKVHPNGCSPFIAIAEGDFKHHPNKVPNSVYSCKSTSAPLETFTVNPNSKWVSFNFISTTTLQAPLVSIDNHPMWLYAVDGNYVKPQKVDGIQVYNGERYSVLVQLNQSPGNYPMRFANVGFNQLINGYATLSYSNAGGSDLTQNPYFTYGGAPTSGSVTQLNTSTLAPFVNNPPSMDVAQTHILNVHRMGSPWQWTLSGNQTYPILYAGGAPLLFNPNGTNGQNENLVIRTNNNTWVDIVWLIDEVPADEIQPPHAMHKHSNKAYIIGSGTGNWTYSTVAEAAAAMPGNFNFKNPLPRDMFLTSPIITGPTWLAIRYQVVNPGAFLIHCHLQTHLAGGMAMAILDGVDAFPTIPPQYANGGNGT